MRSSGQIKKLLLGGKKLLTWSEAVVLKNFLEKNRNINFRNKFYL